MTRQLPTPLQPSENALVVSPHVRTKVLGEDTVLLDLQHGEYYTLNATGGLVWQRLQQGVQIDAIVEELNAEYGVAVDTVALDVAGVVAELVERRLLLPAGAAAPQ